MEKKKDHVKRGYILSFFLLSQKRLAKFCPVQRKTKAKEREKKNAMQHTPANRCQPREHTGVKVLVVVTPALWLGYARAGKCRTHETPWK